MVGDVVGFEGNIRFDPAKPDSTLIKLLDVSKLTALDWQATIRLEEGLKRVCQWYLERC